MIRLNQPMDRESIHAEDAVAVTHWNYRWRREYGSDMYSPTTGEIGAEELLVETAVVEDNDRTLHLRIPDPTTTGFP